MLPLLDTGTPVVCDTAHLCCSSSVLWLHLFSILDTPCDDGHPRIRDTCGLLTVGPEVSKRLAIAAFHDASLKPGVPTLMTISEWLVRVKINHYAIVCQSITTIPDFQ
jgi:hypothetical protein